MAEYIEREAALNRLCQENCGHDFAESKCHNCYTSSFITYLPAADVAPVVHGRWERHPQANDIDPVYVCNLCKLNVSNFEMRWMNYCPNCGARMDGE